MNEQFRQGDVLLVKCEVLPDGARRRRPQRGRLIVARGEATGHSHSLSARHARMFRKGRQDYVQVNGAGGTALEHQEHEPIWLEEGTYRVVHQREYTPQRSRPVID